MGTPRAIRPAEGKLGILCVGLGAVTSTLIAGVELARRGLGDPIGSLTQMGTIRLGRRDESRVPHIKDFVPLAGLDDLVFGAWDPFPDDAYVAASRAGVLETGRHVEPVADALRAVRPMTAAFDPAYVKRIDAPNVKGTIDKRAMLDGIRADIEAFRDEHQVDRIVMIWCASTEVYIEPGAAHLDLDAFEAAIDRNDPTIAPSMLYAYAALQAGIPFANGAPNLTVDVPALRQYATEHGVPIMGKDFKTGQTLIKTVIAPMLKARMLGLSGWYSTNILGNRDGEVLDDPESFKTKEESKLGVLEDVLEPDRYPELYGDVYHKVRINYYPPRGDNKEGWDNVDLFGWLGYPMQLKIDFLCRDSILAAPLALDLCLLMDLAARAGLGGIQEWLSFYFKSPQVAPGLYPEHDLFIQQTKLKNTLRWMMGEEQITHLGIDYYVDELSAQEAAAGERAGARVQRVVIVLLDSLNRHLLGSYGGTEFDTPNLDHFAEQSVRFTRHVTGSLPCMPARHDILCGALDFLWKPWGSIEVWEQALTSALRDAGVVTMLVSDHPHLFETGGENYHTDFTAWDYVRGHEGDPWRTHPDPSWVGTPALPARAAPFARPYDTSRTWFREEADFPGPRTMRAAADSVRGAAQQHERWLLFVDEFDPHEPFDTPAPWAGRYDPDWDGDLIVWPPYDVGAVRGGRLTEAEARQIRANYGAKLSMIDHWFGHLLDALDESGVGDSTAVVVCTDHGHYLGEKDIWGKPGVMQYEPLGHIPLLARWPGAAAGTTCDALTTSVDLFATLADVFGARVPQRTHGVSLLPLLDGTATSVREHAIGGVYGNWVQVTDGRRKYARAPVGDNLPLSLWSNRWSTMPVHGLPNLLAPPDQRAWLDTMPGSEVPVIRQPFAPGDALPYWVGRHLAGQHHLFDVDGDPDEDEDLVGTRVEQEMTDLLRSALDAVEAPKEQLVRLGIA